MTPRVLSVRGMGLSLRVLEWGSGDDVVVMVHGLQDGAWSWDLVAPTLAERGFRVVAPDLRGFGASDRVHESGYYYFPDYVFDLTEVVDAVSPSRSIALVGHSMGGTISTMYAGLYPDRVRKLALLEGVGPPAFDEDMVIDRERAWIEGVRKARARTEKPMTFDEVVRRLAIGHPNVRETILRTRAEQLSRKVGDDAYVWAFDPLHRTRSPLPFSLARWEAHARRVTAKVLCIGGGPTGFHPEDEAHRVAMLRADYVDIGDAGHMLHWTKPEEVRGLLAAFLRT